MRLESPTTPWLLIPDLVCLAVCLAASVTDLRARRIPNLLTLPAALVGLVLNAVIFGLLGGPRAAAIGLLSALAGLGVSLLVFGLLGAVRFVGFGDVKLMAAVGALLRWPLALTALVDVALAGGLVALGHAILLGRLGRVTGNLLRLGRRALGGGPEELSLHRIPYALAILLGVAWAVLSQVLPALRWR